jgi:hypothetical protein
MTLTRAALPLAAVTACNALVGLDDYLVAGSAVPCSSEAQCPLPASPCEHAVCRDGLCESEPALLGTDCGDGLACDGQGRCRGANGAPCDGSDGCATGFCKNGVCCDRACDEPCESCGTGTCIGTRCSGDLRWVAAIGDHARGGSLLPQVPLAVAIDGTGAALVTGYVLGVVDFGDGVPVAADSSDVFVTKLAASGMPLWHELFSNPAAQQGNAVAILRGATVTVGGAFAGDVDLGGGTLVGDAATNLLLAGYGLGDGAPVFSVDVAETGEIQALSAVAAAPDGTWLGAGSFEGTVDLDGRGPIPPVTSTMPDRADALVARFASDGAPLWAKRLGGPEDQHVLGVALGADGATAVVVGDFKGTLDFGGGTLMAADPMKTDAFVAAIDLDDGATAWARGFGDGEDQSATSVSVDASGAIVVAGDFKGTLELGPDHLVEATDKRDAFVAKLDASGDPVWIRSFGGMGDQRATGVTVDAAGSAVLCGYFEGTLDLGGTPHESPGGHDDAWVLKLAADGTVVWANVWGQGDDDDERCRAVASAPDGGVVAVGTFFGTADFGGGVVTSTGSEDGFVVALDP